MNLSLIFLETSFICALVCVHCVSDNGAGRSASHFSFSVFKECVCSVNNVEYIADTAFRDVPCDSIACNDGVVLGSMGREDQHLVIAVLAALYFKKCAVGMSNVSMSCGNVSSNPSVNKSLISSIPLSLQVDKSCVI